MKRQTPREEPTLAAKMRALAEEEPQFADELRAQAQAFEDAANDFYQNPDTRDKLIETWRAARKLYLEIQQIDDGTPRSWQK